MHVCIIEERVRERFEVTNPVLASANPTRIDVSFKTSRCINAGTSTMSGILVNQVVFIVGVGVGGSGYRLETNEGRWNFYCGCCSLKFADGLLRTALLALVLKAKALGATMVVFRQPTAPLDGPAGSFDEPGEDEGIAGLPVEDVERHVGEIEGVRIYYAG